MTILLSFVLWYIIGVITFLVVAKKLTGEVYRMDLLMCTFISIFGPIVPLITLMMYGISKINWVSNFWNKKVF